MLKTVTTEKRLSLRLGLLVVLVAVATLAATSFVQLYFSREATRREAFLRAQGELDGACSDIMGIVNQAEAAVRNCIWIAQWCLDRTDSLYRVPERVVMDNPVVVMPERRVYFWVAGTLIVNLFPEAEAPSCQG